MCPPETRISKPLLRSGFVDVIDEVWVALGQYDRVLKPRGTLHRENTGQRHTGRGQPSTLQGAHCPSFPPLGLWGSTAMCTDTLKHTIPFGAGMSCLWPSPQTMRISTGIHTQVRLAAASSNHHPQEANLRALWTPAHSCESSGSLGVGSPSSSGLLRESAARLGASRLVWGSPLRSAGRNGLSAAACAPSSAQPAPGAGAGGITVASEPRRVHRLPVLSNSCVALTPSPGPQSQALVPPDPEWSGPPGRPWLWACPPASGPGRPATPGSCTAGCLPSTWDLNRQMSVPCRTRGGTPQFWLVDPCASVKVLLVLNGISPWGPSAGPQGANGAALLTFGPWPAK